MVVLEIVDGHSNMLGDTIYFYKTNDPYGFMSNYKKSRFFLHGKWWNNVEAAYQAMKCILPEEATSIWLATTANEARLLGQKVQMRSDWDTYKVEAMRQCLYAKFLQNHDLLKELSATGNAHLVENSPVDSFWGCGADGQGKNHLGLLLEEVREALKGF